MLPVHEGQGSEFRRMKGFFDDAKQATPLVYSEGALFLFQTRLTKFSQLSVVEMRNR